MAAKPKFQFVEEKSGSSSDDVQTRRLVRSNATKFRWQQLRKEKSKQCTVEVKPQIMKMALEVGSGTFDPFDTLPTSLPSDVVTRGLEYNQRIILPKLMPLAGPASEKLHIVLPIAMSDRSLLSCLMIGAMVHQQAARKFLGTRETKLLTQCRNEAVSALRNTLTDPSTALSDITILSVLILAFNGSVIKFSPPRRSPSQGPLLYLQSLFVYTATATQETHLEGLRALIKVRGGLSKLTLPGLAAIISSGDIMRATQTLSKPLWQPFSLVKGTVPKLSVPTISNIRLETSTLLNISEGFQVLDHSTPGRILQEVIEMMADYVVLVGEGTADHRLTEKDIIIDQRNLVQHRLMSLPSYVEIMDTEDSGNLALYESCRISSIIFSVLVIIPMNPATAPFERLAYELKMVCLESNSQENLELWLWISTMGAIAAFSLHVDDYFMSELAQTATGLGLSSWAEYQAVLQRFLWLPATNDVDGKYLWSMISSPAV